eukprot:4753390-Prymnesium_polylepis.1
MVLEIPATEAKRLLLATVPDGLEVPFDLEEADGAKCLCSQQVWHEGILSGLNIELEEARILRRHVLREEIREVHGAHAGFCRAAGRPHVRIVEVQRGCRRQLRDPECSTFAADVRGSRGHNGGLPWRVQLCSILGEVAERV